MRSARRLLKCGEDSKLLRPVRLFETWQLLDVQKPILVNICRSEMPRDFLVILFKLHILEVLQRIAREPNDLVNCQLPIAIFIREPNCLIMIITGPGSNFALVACSNLMPFISRGLVL